LWWCGVERPRLKLFLILSGSLLGGFLLLGLFLGGRLLNGLLFRGVLLFDGGVGFFGVTSSSSSSRSPRRRPASV